ncbi:MAG: J domain-containing protein [Candidatus Pacebacteria bacterium]|nr:J domain-containing protein [Candidatus Paceibacterota bacterium]MCD8507955.1 J domain-containing protein [Candidatus Paceibacterota bacterium]MCD8527982.1 J domain-containing protein [Candidatus Paceibacterota bacterium]MCD8563638.1 J domain-containing protein [Candidatus Paceibacterota bacterium]
MAKDYYAILGVSKSATSAEIKKAFHKLAHQYHPDKGGDEAKFKEINEAYQVLSHETKRAQYDQFGTTGGPQGGFHGAHGFGGFDFSQFQQGGAHFDFGDLGDIFETFMGGGYGVRKGRDIQLSVQLTFLESLKGVQKKVRIPVLKDGVDTGNNKEIEVTVPPGVEHGQRLKLQGYGEEMTGGRPGNVVLQIFVEQHPVFTREGDHIVMDLDVKLTDALLGAQYDIELPDTKKIKVTIPSGLASGEVLRVKGKGVDRGTFHKGDLYIRTHFVMPKKITKKAKEAIEILQSEGI